MTTCSRFTPEDRAALIRCASALKKLVETHEQIVQAIAELRESVKTESARQ